MNRLILVAGLTVALATAAIRPSIGAEAKAATGDTSAATAALLSPVSRVEVAFVLDTTGSMGGLIDGAKRKIWGIADEIRKANPSAEIRIGLVAYRDRGDAYVTEKTDLSTDIHEVYGKLLQFRAQGGGDWPESVNEALAVAVNGLSWTRTPETRRIVFLVGDAPPHMDYVQDVAFTDTLKIAERRGIVVNAVQAGAAADTEVAWRAIAALGHGDYVAIPQSGNVKVIETPYDQQIQKLQLQLNLTVVPYGDRDQRGAVEDKLRLKAEAAPAAASDMASYEIRPAAPAARSVVTGGGDLVADVQAGRADLADVDRDELPEDVRGLSPAELEAAVKAKIAERERIQGEIADLVAKRDAFLAESAAKAGAAEGDSFDGAIRQTIARQML